MKNKKRDPMPSPDATPEEIGEFWDTHSLADYWDETHEVEFQVSLKSGHNPTAIECKAAERINVLQKNKAHSPQKKGLDNV